MSMWYCECCGEFFDEFEIVEKTTWSNSNYIGHGGDFPETEYLCPHCNSDAIAEAEECECCGSPVKETIYIGDYTICGDCYDKLYKIAQKAAEDILGVLADTERCDVLDAWGVLEEIASKVTDN